MTRETDRQLLENITKEFTIEQSKEYAHRIRSVDLLLSRVCPKCRELAFEIKERRKDQKQSKMLLNGLVIAVAVGWILKSLSIVTSDSIFYVAGIMFLFSLARMHFSPEGPNAIAISTLEILTFTTITRIEELGASSRSVFLWVQGVTGLDVSTIREIQKSYVSSEYLVEDDGSIGEDDFDSESDDEIDTSGAWVRICLEIARVVRER